MNLSPQFRSLLDAIENALKYAEGQGGRLEVHNRKDADSVVLLATIKVAN